jgi:hypothetical protein
MMASLLGKNLFANIMKRHMTQKATNIITRRLMSDEGQSFKQFYSARNGFIIPSGMQGTVCLK